MEYLDYYDEQENFIGTKTREEVHKEGLWHNTVQCWLYDKDGYIYFQIRKDTNTFYVSASGHVKSKETLIEASNREIKEEIGVDIDTSKQKLIRIIPWKMDYIKKDGTKMKDRAKGHIYLNKYEGKIEDFIFDTNEVLGIAKIKAKNCLKLFKKGNGSVRAQLSIIINNNKIIKNKNISINQFLVTEKENVIEKYGYVLENIIKETTE